MEQSGGVSERLKVRSKTQKRENDIERRTTDESNRTGGAAAGQLCERGAARVCCRRFGDAVSKRMIGGMISIGFFTGFRGLNALKFIVINLFFSEIFSCFSIS